jgi:antitoxin (DNA-binding transcriptional repressor) of toxin-antitoxin stability system
MEIALKDLEPHSRQLIEAMDRGEEVMLTYRGKPCARVTPVVSNQPSASDDLQEAPLFGIWRDREDILDVAAYMDTLRKPRF